mgnify:CR=1 FL=1
MTDFILNHFVVGKETPAAKPASPAAAAAAATAEVPPTPTYPDTNMPSTPRIGEPLTPRFPPSASATPLPIPSTPVLGPESNSTGDLFGAFMTPKEPLQMTPRETEPEAKQSPKKGRGRPPKKTPARDDENSQSKPTKSEDIMDIVSNVTKNISSTFEKSNEDAPFELTWTGPIATPSMDMFASPSSSMLPPYTPIRTPGATPFNPPSMPNRTPFQVPGAGGMKTPFATPGSHTPFIQPGAMTPMQSRAVTEVAKQSPARSPAQGSSGSKEEEGRRRKPAGRRRVSPHTVMLLSRGSVVATLVNT